MAGHQVHVLPMSQPYPVQGLLEMLSPTGKTRASIEKVGASNRCAASLTVQRRIDGFRAFPLGNDFQGA
jgi:hypothetical protein